MSKPPIGYALSVMNSLSTSSWIDKLGLRDTLEKATYRSTKTGFQVLGAASRQFNAIKKSVKPERLSSSKPSNDLFDLSLTDEQRMMQETVSRFANDVLRPNAAESDQNGYASNAIFAQAQELGLNFFAVPEALGGAGTTHATVTNMIIAEEMAKGDMGLAYAMLASTSVANMITRWGTGKQQQQYLPAFMSDNPVRAAIAVNEATPLFNPTELKTQAKSLGSEYVLKGTKTCVPLIDSAELFLVAAESEYSGIQFFIVESSTLGVSIEKSPAMGLKAANMGTLILNNVKVPKNAMLGNGNLDYSEVLNLAALGWCAMACGTAQAVLDYTITYCNEREAFSEPISHRQSVAFMIANISIELESMRLMTQRAAALAEQGKPFCREAYLARILCGEKSMEIGTNGVQLLGGHGFTKEHPVERWYRDLRAISIMEGGLHL